jgi:tRNA(fMet)-specific endonuclease VapC
MKIVLDTNVYVDFAQGLRDAVDLIATESSQILLPVVVLGELFYGFMKGSRARYNEEKLHHFIATLGVSIIPANEDVARKYALIYSVLSAKGTRIPINDVWIAACCMSTGGTLLTRDRHFEQVEQIDKIILGENWV